MLWDRHVSLEYGCRHLSDTRLPLSLLLVRPCISLRFRCVRLVFSAYSLPSER